MDTKFILSSHARTNESIEDVWGLLMPDGRTLLQGYSQRTLTSREDVIKDFSAEVVALGTPVLLRRVERIETVFTYTVDD